MRFCLLALAACAASPPPKVTCPEPSPCPGCAVPKVGTIPDDDTIKRMSYGVLTAYDRADVPAFEAATAPDFVHFEGGWSGTRDKEIEQLRQRKPGAPFIASRTWENEKVATYPGHVLYTGKATETQGGNDEKGGYKYVGWYTLQWVPEGDRWKLRFFTWTRAGEHAARDTWNDIYKNDVGFNKKPNQLLVDTVKGKKPGTALDLTMGQGRNALYLASQGWKVTGVDFADAGMRVAKEEAAKRKLAIEMVEANIDTWDFGANRWDVVTMIYPGPNHEKWAPKIKPSLKKGGLLVLEYFAYDLSRGQDDGIKPGELAKLFSDFEILLDEQVEGVPDWALDRAKLQRFVARKK